MKLRILKKLIDGVFHVRLQTEDWSENDKLLMIKHGEPEINLGGSYTLYLEPFTSQSRSDDTTQVEDLGATEEEPPADAGQVLGTGLPPEEIEILPEEDITAQSSSSSSTDSSDPDTPEQTVITFDDNYARIMTESPFTRKFDIRDYGTLDNTKALLLLWTSTIENRIIEEVQKLRSKDIFFATEEITEY